MTPSVPAWKKTRILGLENTHPQLLQGSCTVLPLGVPNTPAQHCQAEPVLVTQLSLGEEAELMAKIKLVLWC